MSTNLATLGITAAVGGSVDGYLAEDEMDAVARSHGLRANPAGTVVIRVTGFDFNQVRNLIHSPVVAAMDAATSIDPRIRGVGRAALMARVEAFR